MSLVNVSVIGRNYICIRTEFVTRKFYMYSILLMERNL